jgi:NADPH:quinone reductase-like Zn-dependent oxidoreductase
MRAFKYDYDHPNKFVWTDAFAAPVTVGKDEVLVATIAVSLNPVDYKIPDLAPFAKSRKDTPVGIDFAGRILQVGSKVTDLKVDDIVYGASAGALAEKIIAKRKKIAKVETTDLASTLATLPIAALTALQGLRRSDCLGSKTPRRILILGASGGVGHFAVQLAKQTNAVGTSVIAVTSTKNVAFVKSLGADEVLDYTEIGFDLVASLGAADRQVDLVFDCVSPAFDYESTARKCLKKSGLYVAANSGRTSDWIRAGMSSFLPFNVERGAYALIMADINTKDLEEVAELVKAGTVKPHISRDVKFNETGIREALDLLKSHRVVGKIRVLF